MSGSTARGASPEDSPAAAFLDKRLLDGTIKLVPNKSALDETIEVDPAVQAAIDEYSLDLKESEAEDVLHAVSAIKMLLDQVSSESGYGGHAETHADRGDRHTATPNDELRKSLSSADPESR